MFDQNHDYIFPFALYLLDYNHVRTQLHGFKYSYEIAIIWIKFYDLKYF